MWYNNVDMHEQFRQTYITFTALTVVFVGGLVVLMSIAAPTAWGGLALVLFYVLLFGFVLSLTTLLEVGLRKRFAAAPFKTIVVASLRQGAVLGLLVVSLLMLQAGQLLFWWVGASLILFFLSLEVFLSI